ncbi:MAG: beta-1,6-N-acetylglucosaminyltransferase [Acidimicrobiales bacterium]
MELSAAADELRIGFFVTSYRSPCQVFRLARTLRRAEPDSPIVIHHDTFRSTLDPSLFDTLSNVHVLTSDKPIRWGDLSLDIARWRAFRWILMNFDVDWIVLLSEQDYPITSMQNLRNRLVQSGVDAFIEGRRIGDIEDEKTRRYFESRYLYQYVCLPSLNLERRLPRRWQQFTAQIRRGMFFCVNHSQRLVFIAMGPPELKLRSWIGLRTRRSPFSTEFPCWHHDSWYALSRKSMEHVIDYLDAHPDVIRYYSRTVIPVESVTGTIVFNDPDLEVANVALHEIRWTNPDSGHPDVFRLEDLDVLRSSNAIFARKFDYENNDILDELDKVIFPGSDCVP